MPTLTAGGVMRKSLLALLCIVFFVSGVFTEGTHPEKEFFKGSGFDFVKVNDIIVGTFNLIPVWADKSCGNYIKGLYKTGNEIKEFSVLVKDKKLTGTFGKKEIVFETIDKEKKEIILSSEGNKFVFTYNFAGTNGGHLVDFTFNFQGIDNNFYVVRLDGECCLGSVIFYSVFLTGLTSL